MSWYGHRLTHLRGAGASILLSLAVFSFIASDAVAREDIVPGSRYVPAEAAAMGDAFLPLATDPASALFYNPAGLGRARGFQASLFNLQLYGNTGYFGGFSSQHPGFYKVTSLSSYLPDLKRNPGSSQGVGMSFLPSFYWKGFAFGMLAQSQIAGRYNTDGTVSYRSVYQLIPAAGTGIRLADGIVRLGYSVQWVNQASGKVSNVPESTVPLGYNQGLTKGSALSHTIGFALTLPYRYLPELDIVGRNLFNTRFQGTSIMPLVSNSIGTPADEQMTFDVSLSMVQKLGSGAQFTWVFEDRDFTSRSQVSLLGRIAIGLQFDFRQALFLRGGWGSGYPSAGIGLKRKLSEFSLSWASEEVGNGYHDQRDTRFLLQYEVRAF